MIYKKSMLLILTAILILGIAIQAERMDLVCEFFAEGKLPEKRKGHFSVKSKIQSVTDNISESIYPVSFVQYTSQTKKLSNNGW